MNDVVGGNGWECKGFSTRWPASKSGKVFGCYDKIDGIAVLKGVEIMLLWDGIGWNGPRRMLTARFCCVDRILLRTAWNEDGWIVMKIRTSDRSVV